MPDPSDSRRFAARRSGASSWLRIDTIEDGGDWSLLGRTGDLVAAAGAALARHDRFRKSEAAEACVALSDDATAQRLNARYRGKDTATNVLSFPSGGFRGGQVGAARMLGDVVLAQETALREAAEQNIPPAHHLQHLVVHGLLHLLGLNHDRDEEAREMEALEVEILATLGIPDPYAAEICSGEPARAAARGARAKTRMAADL